MSDTVESSGEVESSWKFESFCRMRRKKPFRRLL